MAGTSSIHSKVITRMSFIIILNDTKALKLHARAFCYQYIHFSKKIEKKILFCWKQFTGKAINSGNPPIKKNAQTFPKMRDAIGISSGSRDRARDCSKQWF